MLAYVRFRDVADTTLVSAKGAKGDVFPEPMKLIWRLSIDLIDGALVDGTCVDPRMTRNDLV